MHTSCFDVCCSDDVNHTAVKKLRSTLISSLDDIVLFYVLLLYFNVMFLFSCSIRLRLAVVQSS